MADNQSNYPIAIPIIDVDHCTGCGRCVAACPPHVLWLESEKANGWGKKTAVLHTPKDCTACAKCYVVCPFDAITMVRT